ncbi:MAG: hypothetical protein HND49_00370 [Planctomycetes bacterium]|nr:hypothetical protein [Planctomycetota bacterium]
MIKVDDFDLQCTLESGQIFRFREINGWYYVSARDKLFKIRQLKNKIEFHGVDQKFIVYYFSLDEEHTKILEEINKDPFINKAIMEHRGLRLIRQDPWECLVAFICSSASNIPRITSKLNSLSQFFGKKQRLDDYTNFAFPLPGKINDYEKIKEAKTGFRAKYIFETNNTIDYERLNSLKTLPYQSAKDELKKFNGVGDKVADCTLLFSLGFYQAFPVDTWIKKIIQQRYFNNKTVPNKTINNFGMDYFGRYAGYAQQFLFVFSRMNGNT